MGKDLSRVSNRVSAIVESATLAVDAKAKALKAAGESVIGFGAGEPDFPTPEHIVEAAVLACRDVRSHRYSPAAGLPELRVAIAEKTMRDSGFNVSSSNVVVTNGGKHAIYNAITTLINPGDEVLLPAPYWTTYPEPVALAGGSTVVLPTDETTGFRVTIDQLEAALTDRTKALIFVSPSNPTGAVYSPDQVEAIGRWALQNGVWVITDEIYEHLTYDGAVFSSMPTLVPELAERCIVVNGVAKTFAMTGWRVGWMIAPSDIVTAASNFQSHTTSNVANVSQYAALAALEGGLDDVVRFREAFDRRRVQMVSMFNDMDGVNCLRPEGAFYTFPSFKAVLGSSIRGRKISSTLELAEVVLDEAKVAMVPGEAFGAPGFARFSFALTDDDIAEGMRRLASLLNERT